MKHTHTLDMGGAADRRVLGRAAERREIPSSSRLGLGLLSLLPPHVLAFCLAMPFPPAQWPQWAASVARFCFRFPPARVSGTVAGVGGPR